MLFGVETVGTAVQKYDISIDYCPEAISSWKDQMVLFRVRVRGSESNVYSVQANQSTHQL